MFNNGVEDTPDKKPVFKEGEIDGCKNCSISMIPEDMPKPIYCTYPKYCGGQ